MQRRVGRALLNEVQCALSFCIRKVSHCLEAYDHAKRLYFKKNIIYGVTYGDQRFRPSDWAERLAGVMSQFRPEGSAGGPLTYSPYVVPRFIDGVRCVVVDSKLRDLEPLAWKFICNFARDNNLKTAGMDFDEKDESA